MLIIGNRVRYRTVGRGVMHCERCGGDRRYRRRSGRRWSCVLGIALVPGERTGEHLRCVVCRTCYRVELLAVPTIARMEAALATGTRAAAVAVLGSGGPPGPQARRMAAGLIAAAGLTAYGEQDVAADLAGRARATGQARATGCTVPRLAESIGDLAVQLNPDAGQWFLASLAGLGLTDGPLTGGQIAVLGEIAQGLGMSQARARDIIARAEQAAGAS